MPVMARRLIALVLPLIVVATSVVTPAAAQANGSTAWVVSGSSTSGSGMTQLVQDGTGGVAQLDYTYQDCPTGPPECGGLGIAGEWLLSTTADAVETVELDWTYTGFHAFFQVTVGLEFDHVIADGPDAPPVVLVNAGPAICCTTPSAGFTYSGTTTVDVAPNDVYGFRMTGANGDVNSTLQGSLTVNVTVPTPPPPGDTAQPDPFSMVVNTADDHTDGLCGINDCSLREAIEWANELGGDTPYGIAFGITGAATIALHAPLPAIAAPVAIDGRTQAGATCPGVDGAPAVQLRTAGDFVVGSSDPAAGLTILAAGGSSVRGLVIGGFPGDGIAAGQPGIPASGFTAECNVIGTAALPNGGAGIRLQDVAPALIGADLQHGGTPQQYNAIAHNGGDGIAFTATAGNTSGSHFEGNLVTGNGGLGIDLGDDGVTANDPGDADSGANMLTNAPAMLRAEGGPAGGIAGTLATVPAAAAQDVVLYYATTCDPSGYGEGGEIIGVAEVTPDSNGVAPFALALSGLPTTGYVTAVAVNADGATSELSNCVPLGAGNDSWPNALDITSLADITGSLNYAGQSRWYRFAITPGSQVSLDLTNLPADYDLLLFRDIAQTYTTLTSPGDLIQLSAEFSGKGQQFSGKGQAFSDAIFSGKGQAFSGKGQQFSGDLGFSGDVFSGKGQAFSGEAFAGVGQKFSPIVDSGTGQRFSPEAYSGAQARSLVGFSLNTGLAPESITGNTWTNTGYYYVRVAGGSGAFDPASSFSLHKTQSGDVCQGVLTYADQPLPAPTGTGVRTVILTDPSRIAGSQTERDALGAKLAALAARPEVAGAVVDVSTIARVADLNAQADGPKVGCPYAKNLVAMALRDIVDSYRTPANPDLAYVVIVGGDGTIPFFRYPDTVDLAPESGYIPPVMPGSASDASLQLNYVLSQDTYGAARQLALGVGTFPVPNLAVGRLVETAAEASGLIDAYLDGTSNGVVPTPTSALTTGYDFMADSADSIAASFAAGIGSGAGTRLDTLIAPNGIAPTDPGSWDADALRASILGTRHDLVFLAGHFSSGVALAADFTTEMSASEIAASTVDMVNAIIFSQGCHSGYNLLDADGIPGVSETLDWAQAFARKQATLIAGTGYQYGDTDLIAYSEAIYESFSRQLLAGSGPVSVGQALVRAKQAYLAANPTLEAIDTKALLQATLFGLPMLRVNLPNGRTPVTTDASIANPAPLTGGTGPDLGLQHDTVTVAVDGLVRHTKPLTGTDGAADQTATWYTGPDGTVTKPFEPALPLIARNVSAPGLVLRGIGLRGGTYADEAGVVPLTGAAATEVNSAHTAFTSPTFFPVSVARPNYFGALAGGETRLLITPVQHRSEGAATVTSTLRLFSDVTVELFYSGETGEVSRTSAPSILGVTATDDGAGGIDLTVRVVGDPAAGVKQAWITYTFGDDWASLDLVPGALDPATWTGNLALAGRDAADLRYIAQAVNGVGLVALDTNDGAYHRLPSTTSTATPNPTSLALAAGNPTTGTFGGTALLSATLSGADPLAGRPVALTLGGTTYTVLTDASGEAHATFPLSDAAGAYAVSASFAGDDANEPSVDTGTFTIAKAATALVLAGPASGLAGVGSGVTATLTNADNANSPIGQRSVVFVVSDPNDPSVAFSRSVITSPAGVASLGAILLPPGAYTVEASFGNDVTLLPSSTVLSVVDGAFAGAQGSKPFEILASGPPHHLEIVEQAASGSANAALTPGLVVQVKDQYGNDAAAEVPVTITLYDPIPETAWLAGFTTKTTDATGRVTFDDLTIDTPGVFALEAATPTLASGFSAPVTITAGSLLAEVAAGDPSWQNHIDGVDVLFTRTGTGASTKYTLRATNPGTFRYQLALENETGATIHAHGALLPPVIRNGVSLTDRNGATSSIFLTVPSMPASVGTTSPLTAAQQAMPAFVLSGNRPIRAYATDGSDDDHDRRNDELGGVSVAWVAELPAGVTRCSDVPATAWQTATLGDGAVVRCIRLEGLSIPRRGRAFLAVNYEFRWKSTPGWGGATSDATQAFRAGFNFVSDTTITLDSFPTALETHGQGHWSRLPAAQRTKLMGDFASLWDRSYRGGHALGLAFAGEKVTAIGGFLFDAGANGLPDVTVRAFSSKPTGDACAPGLTYGTNGLVASYTTASDGFYFLWQKNVDNTGAMDGTNTLASGYKYHLALCDLTADHQALPFDQLYWPARSLSSTLGNKEFVEADFFVSGPTRLAFLSQPLSGRTNRVLTSVKVALVDAFGNVMTVDSTSTVTISAVTAAGNSPALATTIASQPVSPGALRLTAGTATWTGLKLTAAGLYKLNVHSSVGGVPDGKGLAFTITN
ncbi:MAG TPA: CSLREA domain-containing protein [Candidatus Limnocylindrales bacterium]|nr:CSLREA domain-containing protein [Candidatus Limnocylindrales bacterium]